MPAIVVLIAAISIRFRDSFRNIHAKSALIIGTSDIKSIDSRGPTRMNASNSIPSPITNPTMPEKPSQSHLSGAASTGANFPERMRFAAQSKTAATANLPRLTFADPIREPLIVKHVEPNAQHRAVLKAANSPNSGLISKSYDPFTAACK
jgi:hypothetical protein